MTPKKKKKKDTVTHFKKLRRKDFIFLYAKLIYEEFEYFPAFNQMIINQFSVSGLNYIKKEAWRLLS